jgi:hypothetical protein
MAEPSVQSPAQAFNAVYMSRIQPAVAALELRRIATLVGGVVMFFVCLSVGSNIAAALIGTWLAPVGVVFVLIGFACAVAGPAYLYWRTHQALPRLFFQALASGMGLKVDPAGAFGDGYRFAGLNLAAERGERAVLAVMSGQSDGRRFEVAAVQDTIGPGPKTRVTTYQGFLTAVFYERVFPAQVILLREGWGGPPAGLQDVGLVDARFERRFKVFSSDQIESRVLLDPTVIEEVVRLDEGIGGARMQCAFTGQGVYVAIKTVNLPSGKDAWPRLWASVNKPDWVRSLAWDLFWSARLADELKPAEAWTR